MHRVFGLLSYGVMEQLRISMVRVDGALSHVVQQTFTGSVMLMCFLIMQNVDSASMEVMTKKAGMLFSRYVTEALERMRKDLMIQSSCLGLTLWLQIMVLIS